jgi:hypothetical protein
VSGLSDVPSYWLSVVFWKKVKRVWCCQWRRRSGTRSYKCPKRRSTLCAVVKFGETIFLTQRTRIYMKLIIIMGRNWLTSPNSNHYIPKSGIIASNERQRMQTKFWCGNLLQNCHKIEMDMGEGHLRWVLGMYEGVSKRFRTGRLERELQMVQLSTTRCSCIAISWVSLVSFAAITLCVASQRVFIVVSVHFANDSVRKFLDTPSYVVSKGFE